MSIPAKSRAPELAIDGGIPVRAEALPYGRQSISDADIVAVTEVLRSHWLTTGPKVAEFEAAVASFCGATQAVAVSSGTAALHVAVAALGIGAGDEVIVPPMTFAASANAVVYCGGTPVFADVDPRTLLLDPKSVEAKITPRTKAILAVDYAGQPCDYDRLREICSRHGLKLIADACHSLGGAYHGRPVGTLADLTVFSFHPVKPLTTGEGGMIATSDAQLAARMRRFRSHGISTDVRQREQQGTWFYEMVDLGYNYRLCDIQCALGLSQLPRLPQWIARRQEMARAYDRAFAPLNTLRPLQTLPGSQNAYHLYVVELALEQLTVDRNAVFAALRAEGIGVNVHYVPVHLHPYYQNVHGTRRGLCPVSEAAFDRILTLPLFPAMQDRDAADVIQAVQKVLAIYSR